MFLYFESLTLRPQRPREIAYATTTLPTSLSLAKGAGVTLTLPTLLPTEEAEGMTPKAPKPFSPYTVRKFPFTTPGPNALKNDGASATPSERPLPPQHATPVAPRTRAFDQAVLSAIASAINASPAVDGDYVFLGDLPNKLPRMSPDFIPRNYGFTRFQKVIEASGIVDLWLKRNPGLPPLALVRLKPPLSQENQVEDQFKPSQNTYAARDRVATPAPLRPRRARRLRNMIPRTTSLPSSRRARPVFPTRLQRKILREAKRAAPQQGLVHPQPDTHREHASPVSR